MGHPVLMIAAKVSKDKEISRWVDQENLMLDEIESKTVLKDEESDHGAMA